MDPVAELRASFLAIPTTSRPPRRPSPRPTLRGPSLWPTGPPSTTMYSPSRRPRSSSSTSSAPSSSSGTPPSPSPDSEDNVLDAVTSGAVDLGAEDGEPAFFRYRGWTLATRPQFVMHRLEGLTSPRTACGLRRPDCSWADRHPGGLSPYEHCRRPASWAALPRE